MYQPLTYDIYMATQSFGYSIIEAQEYYFSLCLGKLGEAW